MVTFMISILVTMMLPKFTKVLDSFRALEAAQTMRMVRDAQEARCTLGRKYIVAADKVKEFDKGKTSGNKYVTANFTYTLTDVGIEASCPEKNYQLRMLSYLDGRICCDECEGFTEKYETCAKLENLNNFQQIMENDPCKS